MRQQQNSRNEQTDSQDQPKLPGARLSHLERSNIENARERHQDTEERAEIPLHKQAAEARDLLRAEAIDRDDRVKQRKDQRRRRDRQAGVVLANLLGLLLTLLLRDVEVRQTDQPGQHEQRADQIGIPAVAAERDGQHGRLHAEGNDVTQGVDLNAEGLLLLRAVLFGARDFPVEHVAKAAEQQAEARENRVRRSGHSQRDAADRRNEAHIGEHHRIIINTNHFDPSFVEFSVSSVIILLSRICVRSSSA